jgi:sugar phosphate isomerase/epimerase
MINDQKSKFSFPVLKNKFPFRLGTTSYIIPDDVLPNIEFLADKVDDIELVLFESDEISNIPDKSTISRMKDISREHDITFTVHLPMDAHTGHANETERIKSVGKCSRIIERMSPLEPFAYVVHFHGDRRGDSPSTDENHWREQHRKSMRELTRLAPAELFVIETLDYHYKLIEDIVRDLGLKTCLDIGHILNCGHDLDSYLASYLENTRVIHLHGIENRIDHKDISFLDKYLLKNLLNLVSERTEERVLTLEIFSEKDLHNSLKVLEEYVN